MANMRFNVKKITVDPGVSLTPLPNSTKYELNSIKRAWIDCEITDKNSSSKVKLIIEGVNRGRFLTITAKDCPINTHEIMKNLFTEFARVLLREPFLPFESSEECTICTLQVDETEILGVLHEIKDMGGFTIKTSE